MIQLMGNETAKQYLTRLFTDASAVHQGDSQLIAKIVRFEELRILVEECLYRKEVNG
jgi:hypothetical protein